MNLQISHARCRCISHNRLRLALWLSVIRYTSDKMLYVPYRFSVLCKLNRLFSGISSVNLDTFRCFGLHNVFGFLVFWKIFGRVFYCGSVLARATHHTQQFPHIPTPHGASPPSARRCRPDCARSYPLLFFSLFLFRSSLFRWAMGIYRATLPIMVFIGIVAIG